MILVCRPIRGVAELHLDQLFRAFLRPFVQCWDSSFTRATAFHSKSLRAQNIKLLNVKKLVTRNYLSTTPWKHMGEWRHSSTFLDLGTGWRWTVSFTPRPLYPWEIVPCGQWIGGWVRSGVALGLWTLWRREKNRNPAVQPVARHYTDWTIPTS
jgi:hypothetical protein